MSDASQRPLKGIAFILVAMFTFATQDAITKILAQDLAVAQIVMIRYWMFAAFATVLIHNRPGGLAQAIRARRPWLQILRSALMVIEIGIFAWVLTQVPLSTSQTLFAACPLIVTALSPFMLGETVGLRRWLAVTAGFIGVLVILRPGSGIFGLAGFVALLGAAMFAVYLILTRLLSQEDRFETSYGYVAWVGCLLATLVGPLLWQTPSWPQLAGLVVLGCAGIFGHMMMMKAYELAHASVLQPFTYLQLVWGLLIGIFIFAEHPDSFTLIGALIIVCAGIIAVRER